jgi:protein tyrosine/serine phosphatase
MVERSIGPGVAPAETVAIHQRLDRPWRRVRAWLDMLILDHGLLRLFHLNWGLVAPGVFRSAQPAPHQLRRARDLGVRTVLNLRAERDCGAFVLEEEACAALGLQLVNFQVRSRDVPSKELILELDRLFGELEHPILIHCKSGADRTGIVGTLYQILRLDRPVEAALRDQLSWRWGHMRHAKTGMLDYFFERYLVDARSRELSFREWVDEVYDPPAVKAAFMARFRPWLGVDLSFWRE